MTKVYLLWFVSKADEELDGGILIGVYLTKGDAEAAIERLRLKPGFADFVEGFQIYPREVGEDSWKDGFKTYDC